MSPSRLLVVVLRAYSRFISPLTPPTCRYAPSCSAYAVQALQSYGLLRGGRLAVWRLLRCNPWTPGGYDPVPGHRIELLDVESLEALAAADTASTPAVQAPPQ